MSKNKNTAIFVVLPGVLPYSPLLAYMYEYEPGNFGLRITENYGFSYMHPLKFIEKSDGLICAEIDYESLFIGYHTMIKETIDNAIGFFDVIYVDYDAGVVKLLNIAGIKYVTLVPDMMDVNDWNKRMRLNDYSEAYTQSYNNRWFEEFKKMKELINRERCIVVDPDIIINTELYVKRYHEIIENTSDKNHTIVLSVFPGCGPAGHWYEYADKYNIEVVRISDFMYHTSIVDKEEPLFLSSCCALEARGEHVDDLSFHVSVKPNQNYPNNFIKHIKSLMGKMDFIVIHDSLKTRKVLTDNGIPFITIIPNPRLKTEWMSRVLSSGYTHEYAHYISLSWTALVGNIEHEPHGLEIVQLQSCENLVLSQIKEKYESLFK